MLKGIAERLIQYAEKKSGENADWMRDIVTTSPAAFWKFCMFTPMAQHRRQLPLDAYHVVKIAAIRLEDCGPCLQTVVNYAIADEISSAVIQSSAAGTPENLPQSLKIAFDFADAIAARHPQAMAHREKFIEAYGEDALVDAAYAISSAHIFPTVKRVLGYGEACVAVEVRGARIETRQAA
jgi:hypothetical protein